ncbi:hypothetical protein HBI63_073750 [Parastagonospora nodorum]|nr:hypothetical protein HBI63_073750 [Parastagonospora nodorum]KAH6177343.1 hypothetical protein HBI61_127250 [Parastagonospora nodorum]
MTWIATFGVPYNFGFFLQAIGYVGGTNLVQNSMQLALVVLWIQLLLLAIGAFIDRQIQLNLKPVVSWRVLATATLLKVLHCVQLNVAAPKKKLMMSKRAPGSDLCLATRSEYHIAILPRRHTRLCGNVATAQLPQFLSGPLLVQDVDMHAAAIVLSRSS